MGGQTTALPPTIDDAAIWDAWLSQFRLPIINANIEVGTFEALSDGAYTTEALARNCVAALEGRRAVLLANHGVVATGATLAAAVALAFEVENLAGQYLDLLAAGLQPVLLNDLELVEAAAQFADYGR